MGFYRLIFTCSQSLALPCIFQYARHTYATLQMAASSNPYIVSQFLTHKNLGTTLRHSHDVPMALIDTIGKIPLKPKG